MLEALIALDVVLTAGAIVLIWRGQRPVPPPVVVEPVLRPAAIRVPTGPAGDPIGRFRVIREQDGVDVEVMYQGYGAEARRVYEEVQVTVPGMALRFMDGNAERSRKCWGT
jgi:hypothetical protein